MTLILCISGVSDLLDVCLIIVIRIVRKLKEISYNKKNVCL